MKPVVWSVTLSWNGKEETLACIKTISQQTLQPDVILVIDNGSHDGLEVPLKKAYPQVRYLALKENIGFAGGMNKGMQMAIDAGADFVVIPSNDTLLDKDCLKYLVAAMEQYPVAGAVAPKIFLYDPRNHIYFNGGYFSKLTLKACHPGENKPDPHPAEKQIRKTGFINGCTPMYRILALKQVGLFDPAYIAYFEDADLSLRLTKAKWTLLMVPQAKVIHKHGVAYTRNAGAKLKGTVSPTKWMLVTRNQLWFLRRHGKVFQKILGSSYILIRHLAIAFILVLRGRPGKSWGIIKGLWSGCFEI